MKLPGTENAVRAANAGGASGGDSRPWILVATILASSMAFIDSTVVNVALPALQSSFHATVVDVQWVVEAYGLFLGALILVGGSLGDLFGRRLIFLIGVFIFAIASAACGFAANIEQLIVARSIQGVGAALLTPGSLAIISATFDEKTRGQAIGTWSGFTAITTAIGPVLGGWLIEHASWRWAFFVNLPLAVAVIIISLVHIPESRSTTAGRVDWLGAVIITLGLGGLVTGFIESVNYGWGHPLVFCSLLIGVASTTLFIFIEGKTSFPMVPLAVFKSPKFSGANLLTLFLYAAIGIFFFLFPLNLIQVQGYSATAAGAASLPLILLLFFLSRWSGGLVTRYGAKIPLLVGPTIVASAFALFTIPSVGGGYWQTFFPAIVVLGCGMAVTIAPLTTVVMSSVEQDHVGTASGINNAVARVAGVLSVAVLGIVMVTAFSSYLNSRLNTLQIPSDLSHKIQMEENKLAGLPVPTDIDSVTREAIRASIAQAFVFGFRLVLLICAGLAVASAAVAWRMIPNGANERQS
jgi:EmrB/QacA subfamily drug resistance transporter